MSYFVNSNYVKVYPTAYRNQAYSWVNNAPVPIADSTSFNPESRLFTEENITRPYVALCDYENSVNDIKHDKGSFVITPTYSAGNPFEFIIHGYYFNLKNQNP